MHTLPPKVGEEIPKDERPTVVRLLSVRAKLMEYLNLAPDVAVFGPFGDCSASALSHVEDVHVDGMVGRRRVTGPTTMAEVIACCRVFRTCLPALKASPPGPLDTFQKKIGGPRCLVPGTVQHLGACHST